MYPTEDNIDSCLSSQKLLHCVTGKRVEEKQYHERDTYKYGSLDDCPFVCSPDDVSNRFYRVKEPHEASIWPTMVE